MLIAYQAWRLLRETIDVLLEATPEGIEWQSGEPCVRIRLTYLAGKARVSIAR